MTELSVVIVGTDEDQRAILQMQVHATAVAKTQQAFGSLPLASSDLTLRRIQDLQPDVVIVDIPKHSSGPAVHAIELFRTELPKAAVFAVGETNQPQVIISAMRSGAREFLERPTTTTNLLECFVRLTSAQRKVQRAGQRGKLFTFINAKGGSGATSVAVNTALSLQGLGGSTALVDLAPLGHAALHLNAKPSFTLVDAIRNLHRLDESLLEGYMTRCPNGLHLLAGLTEALADEVVTSDFPRLFELLLAHYDYVVVDSSSRMDRAVRVVCDLSDTVLLVAHSDVVSLWSTAKLQSVLGESLGSDRLRLVINRFRKIPGFSERDIEAATRVKVLSKIPEQDVLVAASIDRGIPVAQQNHSEIARAFVALAGTLAQHTEPKKRRSFILFGEN